MIPPPQLMSWPIILAESSKARNKARDASSSVPDPLIATAFIGTPSTRQNPLWGRLSEFVAKLCLIESPVHIFGPSLSQFEAPILMSTRANSVDINIITPNISGQGPGETDHPHLGGGIGNTV